MSLRERAAQLDEPEAKVAEKTPASTAKTPASTKAKATPAKAEPKPKEAAKPAPKAETPKPAAEAPKVTEATSIEEVPPSEVEMQAVRQAVKGLDRKEIEELLAAIESADLPPLTASLKATRETKLEQVQYDGKTPEGYTIRVWAPKGADMVTHAILEVP